MKRCIGGADAEQMQNRCRGADVVERCRGADVVAGAGAEVQRCRDADVGAEVQSEEVQMQKWCRD